MKKLLFALALTSFVGGAAFAHDGDKDKSAKKGSKKECSAEAKAGCAKSMAGGKSCCANKDKKAKMASLVVPAQQNQITPTESQKQTEL